jgi:CheY-like chemotaxis protein
MNFTPEARSERRISVLLVEDNPADASLVCEALSAAHLDCGMQIVSDGAKAVEVIACIERGGQPCPDLVLLDLNLPRRSGEEVLKRLRESRTCCHIKVLIVTSSDVPKERQRVMELGATGYFRKPSTLEKFLELGGTVRQLLESN